MDHTRKIYYFESALSPFVVAVDLSKIDFSPKSGIRSPAPNPAGHMGDYAIQAATSLYNQLTQLYGSSLTDAQRWAMIGVTPRIGLNDVTTETFTQQDARTVEAWAASHGIGLLSMWSLNRDRQNGSGVIRYVDTNSSSLAQTPNEFSGIFLPFTR